MKIKRLVSKTSARKLSAVHAEERRIGAGVIMVKVVVEVEEHEEPLVDFDYRHFQFQCKHITVLEMIHSPIFMIRVRVSIVTRLSSVPDPEISVA